MSTLSSIFLVFMITSKCEYKALWFQTLVSAIAFPKLVSNWGFNRTKPFSLQIPLIIFRQNENRKILSLQTCPHFNIRLQVWRWGKRFEGCRLGISHFSFHPHVHISPVCSSPTGHWGHPPWVGWTVSWALPQLLSHKYTGHNFLFGCLILSKS